jgi:hypothetical protein
MTLEEALAKVADADAKAMLQKVINDQNKYIGQLETQLKAGSTNTPTKPDDVTMKYLEKNMRRDVIAEAVVEIKKDVSEEVFKAIEPDFMEFLNANMKKENTTVGFCTDAFSLVYGKCLRNKDHAVHKIGKDTNPQGVTPTTAGTNGPSVAAVNSILQNQPPVITDKDQSSGAVQGLPNTGVQVKSTRDAFSALKNRFANNGGNKFM